MPQHLSLPHQFATFLSVSLVCIAGIGLAGLAIPPAAYAADTVDAATTREAMRRKNVRERMNAHTRSYVTVVEEATIAPTTESMTRGEESHMRSASYKARLLCRVKERYNDPNVLSVTKERLIQRLSDELLLSRPKIVTMLTGTLDCEEIFDGLYPYLFYEGYRRENMESATVGIQGAAITLFPPVPSSMPADTTASSSSTPINTAFDPGTAETILLGEDGGETPSIETMLRLLCRVQQRSKNDARALKQSITSLAQNFADRWNVEPVSVAAALLDENLCTHPETLTLIARVQNIAPIQEEGLRASVQSTASAHAPSVQSSIFDRLRALPPIILVVGGLTALTFFALMLLIIWPFFHLKKK